MKIVFNMKNEQHERMKQFQADRGLFTMSEAIRVACGEALKREYSATPAHPADALLGYGLNGTEK